MTGKLDRAKSASYQKRLRERTSAKRPSFRSLSGEIVQYESSCLTGDNTADVVELINSEEPERQMRGMKTLRRMLVKHLSEKLIEEVIDFGLLMRIVWILKNSNEKLQYEAAWILTNLATSGPKQTRFLIEAGSVEALINLLMHGSDNVQEQSAWALGNIACDSDDFRDFVLEQGSTKAIVNVLKTSDRLSILQASTWLLSILCKGVPDSHCKYIVPTIEYLRDLLRHADDDLVSQTCWCLASFSEGPNRVEHLLAYNIAPFIAPLLTREEAIVIPALHVLGNIVTGDELPTQVMIDCGVMSHVVRHLESANPTIRKEACWILSNISAGSNEQIQAVLDSNPFPFLFHILSKDNVRTKKEVVWMVRNITTGGSNEQIKFMVAKGAVEQLCRVLSYENAEITKVALGALEVVLRLGEAEANSKGVTNPIAVSIEDCGGVVALESLLSHEEVGVYRPAYEILERHFNTSE